MCQNSLRKDEDTYLSDKNFACAVLLSYCLSLESVMLASAMDSQMRGSLTKKKKENIF